MVHVSTIVVLLLLVVASTLVQQARAITDWLGCQDDSFKREAQPEGGYICVKRSIQVDCSGYYDAQKKWQCCPPLQTYMLDEKTQTGACCNPVYVYVVDEQNQPHGGCCPLGLYFKYSPTAGKGECCASGFDYSFDARTKTGFCCKKEMIWDGDGCANHPTEKQQATPVAAQPHVDIIGVNTPQPMEEQQPPATPCCAAQPHVDIIGVNTHQPMEEQQPAATPCCAAQPHVDTIRVNTPQPIEEQQPAATPCCAAQPNVIAPQPLEELQQPAKNGAAQPNVIIEIATQALTDWDGCQDSSFKRESRPEGGFICVKREEIKTCSGYLDDQKKWQCCPQSQVFMLDEETQKGDCCNPSDVYMVDKLNKPQGGCCSKGQSYQYSPLGGKGACCAINQAFSFDTKTKTGFCCPTDMIWDGNTCRLPTPVPSLEKPSSTEKPSSYCQQRKICPSSCDDIGLKYGHCYTIAYPDGDGLNRAASNEYRKGATYSVDIPFRVCTVDKDCKYTDKSLSRQDGFLLRDERGVSTANSKGWVYSLALGAHFLYLGDNAILKTATDFATGIVPFVGKPSCLGDGCSICLNTQIKQGPGLGLVCPVEEQHAFGVTVNPNMCMRFEFYEIKCDEEMCPT